MRCLGEDLRFHWVYNHSTTLADAAISKGRSFDINKMAFVRKLDVPSPGAVGTLTFVEASSYAMSTTVPGTSVSYADISSVARMPFQQKSEWLKIQFTAIRTPWEEGHIKLKVRRASLLQDSMEGMESIQSGDMRKIFRFDFIGEPGLDAGGVAREWYNLVAEQLFNPDCGLFLYSSVNQMCMQINANSGIANEYHLRYFHFAGRVLGKALMDGHITPVHLVAPLYKHLMGFPITLNDLEHIDDQDVLGMTQTVSLVEGGEDITVIDDNLGDYLREQLKYRLLVRIQDQLREFLKGFYDVVPEPLLAVFDFKELELLLHGLPNIKMEDWMAYTEYSGEFLGNSNHKVVKWFWEIVSGYSQENKAKLLQFST
ncbi:Nedd4, partial [Symbiodinium microadriaticum]